MPNAVLLVESVVLAVGSEKPEEPNLMAVAWEESLAGLIPKLIEEEGVVRVAAAATRVENFVLGSLDEELSAGFSPGRRVEQQAHVEFLLSFLTRQVAHDHFESESFKIRNIVFVIFKFS